MARIILIGLRNVGKTTFGTKLAAALQLPFIDSDAALEAHYHQPKAVLWCDPVRFRAQEKGIWQVLQHHHGVIATGGGTPLHWHTKPLGLIVHLQRPVEELRKYGDISYTQEEIAMRLRLYHSYADKTLHPERDFAWFVTVLEPFSDALRGESPMDLASVCALMDAQRA